MNVAAPASSRVRWYLVGWLFVLSAVAAATVRAGSYGERARGASRAAKTVFLLSLIHI